MDFKIKYSNLSENTPFIRLSISFIASRMDFSLDDIEDLKLMATEACNMQIGRSDYIDCTVFTDDDKLVITFDYDNNGKRPENEKDKISQMIIESLSDRSEFSDGHIVIEKDR
ncbi:MAG: anti-sigma factor [Finegoldia sp.]|nr:anti-sigma factor [Finegoldia sp.]